MAKYAPLARFLRRQKGPEIELTFLEIERIVGALLPKAAMRPDWWRSEAAASREPQHLAFGGAGFVAHASPREERVRFVRREGRPVPDRHEDVSAGQGSGT
jgi:hypothetical protein